MPTLLMLDYGSSSNYGDKVVSQVMRDLLGRAIPDLVIKPCTGVPDGHIAAYWSTATQNPKHLLAGVDCVLLFGGSIFFDEVIKARGSAVVEEAHAAGIPVMVWGGMQCVEGCFAPDVAPVIKTIVDCATVCFCRFNADVEPLEAITGHIIDVGGDIMFLRPRLWSLPSTNLAVAISPPRGGGVESVKTVVKFIQSIQRFHDEVISLRVDPNVLAVREIGLDGGKSRDVAMDTWIDAITASVQICISTRLHPAVAAVSHGNPVIGIDSSDKVTALLEDVGTPETSIRLESVTMEALTSLYEFTMDYREELRDRLLVWRGLMREKASLALDTIIYVISSSG